MAFEFIDAALQARAAASLLRHRQCVGKVSAREIEVDGEAYLNFASNDYLALADETLSLTAQPGSRSSALVTGFQSVHSAFEAQLCDAFGYDRALLFASGFAANTSVIQALFNDPAVGRESELFQDKLNHASLLDGALNSQAKLTRFNHNDITHLRARLEKSKAKNKLIVTEGVFSMDGDCAPLVDIAQLAKTHNAWLMVDDAHALGVLGDNGLGSIDSGIKPELLVITFGKAMACQGAAVLCSQRVQQYLLQFSREYIYSTAMSPMLTEIAIKQFAKLRSASLQRAVLKDNIAYFTQTAAQLGIPVLPSTTAIQPVVLGSADNALAAQQQLKAQGIWLTAIRPPTVPQNAARLRITLTAAHTSADIDTLLNALKEAI
ncbi:aminotransferase class I/II-fold pyridoxal phosphate-dependent enzyme [Pseudoalteromonas ardens]|uniref:8-amino-7-oxononanoate synthase n=1 Tax=Pseudoalteromonas rubra TaxID=43658 RepID=A0A0L0ENA7_9GAMM|nr:8-amino-7-oxononanoate synthase [Pseudoalteromonas sp. R96]KNC65886.1 8-amino-7-oxononanoate synthase [Pseudoalteromonas rubra]MDK1310921.1 8-amino-7-oxononanoate synthase [Pseudoalteromonas sp. R96]